MSPRHHKLQHVSIDISRSTNLRGARVSRIEKRRLLILISVWNQFDVSGERVPPLAMRPLETYTEIFIADLPKSTSIATLYGFSTIISFKNSDPADRICKAQTLAYIHVVFKLMCGNSRGHSELTGATTGWKLKPNKYHWSLRISVSTTASGVYSVLLSEIVCFKFAP